MTTPDKNAILALLRPVAVLRALTPEAELAVPDGLIETGYVAIRRLPYRVGRESRGTMVDGKFHRIERPRLGKQKPNNDLYLVDTGQLLQVSREHFQIEQVAGGFRITDRGSTCGVVVGAVRIGGTTETGSAPLQDGDTIAIGTDATPYRFQFITF